MVAAAADVAKVAEFNPVGGNLEFYGATDPEVLAVGPAGCVAGETRLYDPITGQHTPIIDLYRQQRAPVVLTLNGPVQAEIPFRKGVADLFRVTMESGTTFVVTGNHRVLGDQGWIFVDDVQPGDRLLASLQYLPASSSGACPSALHEGDHRSVGIPQDCQGDCSACHHLCDAPLRQPSRAGLVLAPSQGDALVHSHADRSSDDLESSAGHSHPCRSHGHLATTDYSPVLTDPTAYVGPDVARYIHEHGGASSQSHGQSQTATLPEPQALGAGRGSDDTLRALVPCSALSRSVSGGCVPDPLTLRTLSPSLTRSGYGHTRLESAVSVPPLDACIPSLGTSKCKYTVQWDTVSSITYERTDEYFDLHVPVEEHYLAEGMWHHNTGKTMAAVWKLHDVAMGVPGVRILMARKVLEDLKTGALATYTNHVKPELDGVITFGGNRFYPGEFRYPNGSVIHVVGMDKPGKVMSAEYDIIFVNEATEISEEILQALKSRLRNGVLGYQQLIMDCNPSGPRHWLNKRCNAGTTRRIVTTHKDNPAYWDADRQEWTEMGRMYVQDTLGSLTGIERERLFLGKWAAAEGLVYPEFNPDVHERVVDTDGWRCVLGVDVGTNNPTAILVAFVAGDGRIHIADELYRRGLGTKGILDAIKGYTDEYNPDAVYVDPSAKAYITDLHAMGIPAVGANNDVLTGIQRVRSVFQTGFSVDPRCVNLIDEFGMYAYPSNAKAETDKPAKEHDHAADSLRYLCMGAAEPVINLMDFYS